METRFEEGVPGELGQNNERWFSVRHALANDDQKMIAHALPRPASCRPKHAAG